MTWRLAGLMLLGKSRLRSYLIEVSLKKKKGDLKAWGEVKLKFLGGRGGEGAHLEHFFNLTILLLDPSTQSENCHAMHHLRC